MSLLLIICVAFVIGFIEWFIALRRTLALTRGERWLTFVLVLVESILGWVVLSSFLNVPIGVIEACPTLWLSFVSWLTVYKWKILVVLSTAFGGAFGSLFVHKKKE